MRLEKQYATGMDSLVQGYIRLMKLGPALNRRRIYAAWDSVTGAGPHTIRKSFKDGKLYITLSSSVMRSILYMQRDLYAARINAALKQDELFTQGDEKVGSVKEIILK